MGQEYPQVVFISSQITSGPVGLGSYLSYLVVHEVLHQWYYALVGDDQLYEPWVDEAVTVHLSYRYLEAADAGVARRLVAEPARPRRSDASIWEDRPVNTSIYDYDDEGHYFAMVYRKGAAFLEEVRQTLGDQTLPCRHARLHGRIRGGFATGRDLLSALTTASPKPLQGIIARYFSYPGYQAAPTATTTPARATITATPTTATPGPDAAGTPEPAVTASPSAATATATTTAVSSPSPSATISPAPSATATDTVTSTPAPSPSPTVEATATAVASTILPLLPPGADGLALAGAGAALLLIVGAVVVRARRRR